MTTRRTKIAALVAGCAVVAGGGYAAADALSGPAGSSSSASGGPEAAALSSAMDGASLSADSASASGAKAGARRKGVLAALRRLPGEYGQYHYQTRKGQKVLAFERGTITSVSGTTVTVKAANGHTENWILTGRSVVREDGKKSTDAALAGGRKVLVAGPVTASAQDARVIIVRDRTAGKSARKSTATTAS